MFNEEVEKTTNLGVNPYETKEEIPKEQLETNDEVSYFGKPEKYDYSQVQLPENYCYDENLLNEFNELAGKYNLSQRGADELMSMAVKLTQLTGENYSKAMAEQQRQTIENYKRTLVNDREIGGVNFDKTMRTANIAYTQFADDEVQNLLQASGLNCHPKIVKMFYEIGKKMQNDNILGGNIPAIPKENREDILFPTM
jgi:hypothetical protein